jgi:hypothetical protein
MDYPEKSSYIYVTGEVDFAELVLFFCLGIPKNTSSTRGKTMRFRSVCLFPVSAFVIMQLLFAGPVSAFVQLNPGGEVDFVEADSCTKGTEVSTPILSRARADSDCNAAGRWVKAETRPIGGLINPGFTTIEAFAALQNDFEVVATPGTEGNTVGAWISYDVQWAGFILFIGFFSNPAVEVAITLKDLTDNKLIGGQLIWGRDGKGISLSIPYVPLPVGINVGGGRDSSSVFNTFSAVLTRGHMYRLEVKLTCSVFSDGGLDLGTECDYMDDFISSSDGGVTWNKLFVKVGLDESEVLEKLEEFESHTHTYLTGKGQGHNNTEASTDPPMFP